VSVRLLHMALEETGETFMTIVREKRLAAAARELAATDEGCTRVLDVALRWGFSDLSSFNRAFKQRFGLPPRRYALIQPAEVHAICG
jgi:AraC family transcriptional activator of tynA and feaB